MSIVVYLERSTAVAETRVLDLRSLGLSWKGMEGYLDMGVLGRGVFVSGGYCYRWPWGFGKGKGKGGYEGFWFSLVLVQHTGIRFTATKQMHPSCKPNLELLYIYSISRQAVLGISFDVIIGSLLFPISLAYSDFLYHTSLLIFLCLTSALAI